MSLTDPGIIEAEINGGDSPIIPTYCRICDTEIEHGTTECEDCRNSYENYKEELAEDDELFKE